MYEKENHRVLTKTKAFQKAMIFWEKGDIFSAETYAITAMELGSKVSAPQLLETIANSTGSKNTAMTLSSYYWNRKNIREAEKWATHARQFGSKTLAQKRLDEITAHKEALALQHTVENFSPPVDESPSLKKRK